MPIYALEPFTPKRYSVEHLLMFFSDISQRQHDVRRTFVRHLLMLHVRRGNQLIGSYMIDAHESRSNYVASSLYSFSAND